VGESRQREGRPELISARRQRGLSQVAAAEAVGVGQTTWARWERGEQGVRASHRAKIATAFGVDAVEVERWIEGWAFAATSSWPLADFGGGSLVDTVKTAAQLWRYEMNPSRRHLLATLPFVPTALGEWLTAWNYGISDELAVHHGSGPTVGLADVDRINEAIRAFKQMDDQVGAGVVRPVVMNYLNSSVSPLLQGRYDDKVGAELMSAAAGMTALAGWTAFDLNRHGQAQHYFGQALRLAKLANDPLLGAWVLSTLTRQAIHLEQSTWAVWLARAAVDTARRADAPPRVMALMLVREAHARALSVGPAEDRDMHKVKQVERLLIETERACAQGATDRDPVWTSRFDEVELRTQAGDCWSLLGEQRRALACAEEGVNAFSQRLPRSAQFCQVNAAKAYLGMGELEQALDTARTAIPMTKALHSARSVERLRQFAGLLEPYNNSIMVREFHDHLNHALAA